LAGLACAVLAARPAASTPSSALAAAVLTCCSNISARFLVGRFGAPGDADVTQRPIADPVFDSTAIHADPGGEIANILGSVRGHVATGRFSGKVMDSNGNTVGEFLSIWRTDPVQKPVKRARY
jgi:hypothetical protein